MPSTVSAYVLNPAGANADLERRVAAYLATRSHLSFRRLTVFASQGTVTLSGRLSSYHERQVALESVRRVAGVLKIVDQVHVERSTDPLVPTPKFAAPHTSDDMLVEHQDEVFFEPCGPAVVA